MKKILRSLIGVWAMYSIHSGAMETSSIHDTKKPTLPLISVAAYAQYAYRTSLGIETYRTPVIAQEIPYNKNPILNASPYDSIARVIMRLHTNDLVGSQKRDRIYYSMGVIQGSYAVEDDVSIITRLFGPKEGVVDRAVDSLQSSPYKWRLNIFCGHTEQILPLLHELFPCKHRFPYDIAITVKKNQGDSASLALFSKDHYCIEDVQHAFMRDTYECCLGRKGKLDMDQEMECVIQLTKTSNDDISKTTQRKITFSKRAGDVWREVERCLRDSY